MARHKKPEGPENHERWMVSYADFVTLLFAFFVVMFASSQADKAKAKQVSQSVRQAIEENQVAAVLAGILGGGGDKSKPGPAKAAAVAPPANPPEKVVELGPSQQALTEVLKPEIAAGKIHVAMEARGLVISLREAAFFASGDDRIEPGAYSSIEKIAAAICKIPNPVRLEGHTDSVPIHNSRFRSNWELSAARGIAMLELLSTRYGVGRDRLAIVGYAENMPVAGNDSEEGRAHNRRVDVVLLNQRGLAPEPQPKTPPANAKPPAPGPHH
jgi:chemotaxis protein MotB